MAYKAPIDEAKLIEDLRNPATAKQGFDTLVRLYGEPIYWQIRKMVGSHEDANDLLQNCFLRVWNNLHSFRGDARLSTWLYKIAVNESINFLNKERQRRNLTAGEGGEDYIIEKLKVIHTSMAMTCRKPCRKQSHPFRKSRDWSSTCAIMMNSNMKRFLKFSVPVSVR